MTKMIWKLVVGTFLAAVGAGVLASEPRCTADVCSDPTWPEMATAAPALTLASPGTPAEQTHAHLECHVTSRVAAAAVDEHLTRDELAVGDPESVHLHPGPALLASAR